MKWKQRVCGCHMMSQVTVVLNMIATILWDYPISVQENYPYVCAMLQSATSVANCAITVQWVIHSCAMTRWGNTLDPQAVPN